MVMIFIGLDNSFPEGPYNGFAREPVSVTPPTNHATFVDHVSEEKLFFNE